MINLGVGGWDFGDYSFLPGGHETSLHVSVSARGIVLEDAHFVPLLAASVFFSLDNDISFRALKNI